MTVNTIRFMSDALRALSEKDDCIDGAALAGAAEIMEQLYLSEVSSGKTI